MTTLVLSTPRRWAPYGVASFDTSALGSPVPSCLSTRQQWAPCAVVSFDTSVLGFRAFVSCDTSAAGSPCLRHVGSGCPLLDTTALGPLGFNIGLPCRSVRPLSSSCSSNFGVGVPTSSWDGVRPPRLCVMWDRGVVVGVAKRGGLRRYRWETGAEKSEHGHDKGRGLFHDAPCTSLPLLLPPRFPPSSATLTHIPQGWGGEGRGAYA